MAKLLFRKLIKEFHIKNHKILILSETIIKLTKSIKIFMSKKAQVKIQINNCIKYKYNKVMTVFCRE